jgi:uncharacterized protein (TIGR01777 family)
MNVLIADPIGTLSPAVTRCLSESGHQVSHLVTSTAGPGEVWWDPEAGKIDAAALEGFDGVVNLSTVWFTLRWNTKANKKLLQSRIATNALLARSLASCAHKPRVLVCASDTGYYASSGDTMLSEDGPAGTSFLARLAQDAEAATGAADAAGIRVVHLRIPLVMGGPMLQFIGFQAGEGKQWTSWVGRDELASMIELVLRTEALCGPVNAASPNPLRNAEFALGSTEALEQKPGGAMPVFILRMSMGEFGEEIYLSSRRVHPTKLLEAGYHFHFPDLAGCLRHEKQYPDAVLPAKDAGKSTPVHV